MNTMFSLERHWYYGGFARYVLILTYVYPKNYLVM